MFMLIIDIAKKGISRFFYIIIIEHLLNIIKVTMMIVIIIKILTRDRIGPL